MKKPIRSIGWLVVLLFTLAAAGKATFSDDKAQLDFPQTVSFSVNIQSPVDIKSIVLEYGTDQLTCGTVIAKAFPDFTQGKSASVSWKWDMRQSGSLPPGTHLWWQWVVTDTGGNQTTSPRSNIIWLDTIHPWQSLSGGNINLHWYDGDQAFGKTLHDTAAAALKLLDTQAGAHADQPVDIYVYGQTKDMQDAVLFEPGWTGGLAYAPYNIVIIGINQDTLDWGKLAEAHELTHVVVGHLTFNCLWSMPTWLNEGLAKYSEGKLDATSQQRFDQAVKDDTLMSLRALSGNFSEKSDKADLSYSESFSVVKFVLETYGRAKMSALLIGLRNGSTADEALQATYGFDTDGLEDAWRQGIGARTRALSGAATATPIPTFVPTFQPVSGIPGTNITPVATPVVTLAAGATATNPVGATATATPAAAVQKPANQVGWLAVLLAAVCCVILLGFAAAVVFLVLRRNGGQSDAQQ